MKDKDFIAKIGESITAKIEGETTFKSFKVVDEHHLSIDNTILRYSNSDVYFMIKGVNPQKFQIRKDSTINILKLVQTVRDLIALEKKTKENVEYFMKMDSRLDLLQDKFSKKFPDCEVRNKRLLISDIKGDINFKVYINADNTFDVSVDQGSIKSMEGSDVVSAMKHLSSAVENIVNEAKKIAK